MLGISYFHYHSLGPLVHPSPYIPLQSHMSQPHKPKRNARSRNRAFERMHAAMDSNLTNTANGMPRNAKCRKRAFKRMRDAVDSHLADTLNVMPYEEVVSAIVGPRLALDQLADVETWSVSNKTSSFEQDPDVAEPLPFPQSVFHLDPLTAAKMESWNVDETQHKGNPPCAPLKLLAATSTTATTTTTNNTRLPIRLPRACNYASIREWYIAGRAEPNTAGA